MHISGHSYNVVIFICAQKGSELYDYRSMWTPSRIIFEDARPKIVYTPLRLTLEDSYDVVESIFTSRGSQ
jgi:hypothetical protein